MQTVYSPKGRAQEYASLALNLYRGCSHGCTYCYAPNILKMTREQFDNPIPRPDIIPAIEKVARQYAGQSVFLCFTCDPYQHCEPEFELTRQTIKILHSYEIGVRILTKGGLRSIRDFDLLGSVPTDAYGATLTFCHQEYSDLFEPKAAPWLERIKALKEAHERGIYTWVSLEPVIDPMQTLELIEITTDYVDEYKVGKWNYDKRAHNTNWRLFVSRAVDLFEVYGKKYYLKEDLKCYL